MNKKIFLANIFFFLLTSEVIGQISTGVQPVSFNMDITSLEADKGMVKIMHPAGADLQLVLQSTDWYYLQFPA